VRYQQVHYTNIIAKYELCVQNQIIEEVLCRM